jgi:hypothetical protein
MTRFVEIFRKLFELTLVNYTFFQKNCIMFVLLCIVYVILLIEEKLMSYVLVVQSVYSVQDFSFWPFFYKFQQNGI